MPVLGRPWAASLHRALEPEALQLQAKRLRLHATRAREPVCTARQQGLCSLNPLTGAPSLDFAPHSRSEHIAHRLTGWRRRGQGMLLNVAATALTGAAWTQDPFTQQVLRPSASWRAQRGLTLPQTAQEQAAQRHKRPVLWAGVQLGAWLGLGLRLPLALLGAAAGLLYKLALLGVAALSLGIFPFGRSPLCPTRTAILPPQMGPELDAFVQDRISEHLRGKGASLQNLVQPEGLPLYPWLRAFPTLTQRRQAQGAQASVPPHANTGLLRPASQELTELVQWDALSDAEKNFFEPLCSQAVLLALLHGDHCHRTPAPILCRTGRAYCDTAPDEARVRITPAGPAHTFELEAKLAWWGEKATPYRLQLCSGQGQNQPVGPEQLPCLTFAVGATVTTVPSAEGSLALQAVRAHVGVDSVGLTHRV